MKLGLYTSIRYLEPKLAAVREAATKLNIPTEIIHDESLERPSSHEQAFGFEELFQRAKHYASEAAKREDVEIGIGIENALAYIYTANEWYYVLCVALCKKDGTTTASFTPGISVPDWMIKEVQESRIKIDALTQRLAGEDDPVIYFSDKTLSRKDLMVPALLLAFAKFNLENTPTAPTAVQPATPPPPPPPSANHPV